MLVSLHIENIAVVKSLDIDFQGGFTALTGETGAGKSVILDGIELLLGKRADKEMIRHGNDHCMCSGLFHIENPCALAETGISADDDGNILIQRTVYSDGRSSVRINDRAVSLTVLRRIASMLVDIHGQSDTASLIDEEYHLGVLDSYWESGELLDEYSAVYAQFVEISSRIDEIKAKENERARLCEILRYQIADIESVAPGENEEDELIDKKVKIKNSERIIKQAGFVFKALKGSEKGSVSYLLDRSINALSSLSDVIPEFEGYAERLRDYLYGVGDIAEEVYASIEDIDEDPTSRLNEIEERLEKISKLKRKYGLTTAAVLEYLERSKEELMTLENSEEILGDLENKLDKIYADAVRIADKIHQGRALAAGKFENEIKGNLEFLDMPKVAFITAVEPMRESDKFKLSHRGYDAVSFYFSANKGLDPQPLSRIASGGELARIMLAIKCAISKKYGINTLIFDEIDTGVSGKTARKIGIKMLELAKEKQLISITHSAQIASLSHTHLLIKKSDVGGSTESSVTVLDHQGRVSELSRILGGINVTEAQRQAALDMLKERSLYL